MLSILFFRILKDETGVLTFEWITLLSLMAAGAGGALAGVRDAVDSELGDVAEAIMSLDQSYYISSPWEISLPEGGGGRPVWDGATYSYYRDSMTKPTRVSRMGGNVIKSAQNSEFRKENFIQTL